jgi:serine/threonine-protein kinase
MGELYRAIDTKLDRQVAIKVLPKSFAAGANQAARFSSEAKVLPAQGGPYHLLCYLERS